MSLFTLPRSFRATSAPGAGSPAGSRALGQVRGWDIWSAPPSVRRYVLTIDLCAALALAVALARLPVRGHDLAVFLGLTACGLVGAEASRHLGAPSSRHGKPYKDLFSAWTLPAAMLLPPAYAMLAPAPLYLYAQWRVTRIAPMKRVFNTAAVALAGLAAHGVFLLVAGRESGAADLVGGLRGYAALPLSAGVASLVAIALVAGVLRRVAPGTPWRHAFGNTESFYSDAGEFCLGIMVAVLVALNPATLLFAIPPVLLLQRALLHTELQTAARTDAKTGLANPRHWRDTAERALRRARRDNLPVGVLLIDVDHFKRVNDSYGHLAGDVVLLAVADAITADTRPGDLAGRYGGEEFTLLLPEADTAAAAGIAERIRERVGDLSVTVRADGPPVRISVSIGVAASLVHGDDVDGLLAAADTALYAAKNGGRNRTCIAPPPAALTAPAAG